MFISDSRADSGLTDRRVRSWKIGMQGRASHFPGSACLVISAILGAAILASGFPSPAYATVTGEPTNQAHPEIDATNPAFTAGLRGGRSRGGGCKVPTDGSPSPLFGARSFTQKLLRFEEFGSKPLEQKEEYAQCRQNYDTGLEGFCPSLPLPTGTGHSVGGRYTSYASPDYELLDQTMATPLYPYPTREARTDHPNPWQRAIEEEHTGPLQRLVSSNHFATSVEGRPPGPQFAHQRWDEFFPRVYSQTAQAGIRPNMGSRTRVSPTDISWGMGTRRSLPQHGARPESESLRSIHPPGGNRPRK